MASEPEHGGSTGVTWHNKRHEPFCLPCANHASDRQRAYSVLSGRRKSMFVSVDAVVRVLSGDAPADVFAAEFGPQTMAALAKLVAVSRG